MQLGHLSAETLDYVASRLGVTGDEFTMYCPMRERQFARLRARLGMETLIEVAQEWVA